MSIRCYARELEHQLNDAGAEVLVIIENFASVYQNYWSYASQTCRCGIGWRYVGTRER